MNKEFTPPPYVKYKYNNINGLRALSAIGIAVMHYQANLSVKPCLGWVSDVLIPWFSWLVFLFFMISGFALCCGYYDRMKNGKVSLNEFYGKRYKRILPFFGLLCVFDLLADFSKEHLAQAFMNVTLVFNLLPDSEMKVIGVGWFLGLIFLFYMLFPFFVFLLDNKRRAWMVLGLSLIVNLLCQEYFFTDAFVGFDPDRRNILYSAPFLLAGGLCFLYRDALHRWAVKRGKFLLIWCIVVNALYFVCPQSVGTLHKVIPLLAVFTLWLIYAMGAEHGWMHNRVMDFLSNISMEIYLCHMLMFRIVERIHLENFIQDENLLFIVTCVAGIGASVVFSYVVRNMIDYVFLHSGHGRLRREKISKK
ncbi:acyltransferase family protein [Paraprevotella clara]|uniref:acyltransferase family protein n=1 Tax=Paraprevotella clara TaxID=454154 RepID=UPI001DC38D00|nr:acyltransferase [Paraprevotella clara]MBS6984549.1 acyltransferase [Paraprevotella clara]